MRRSDPAASCRSPWRVIRTRRARSPTWPRAFEPTTSTRRGCWSATVSPSTTCSWAGPGRRRSSRYRRGCTSSPMTRWTVCRPRRAMCGPGSRPSAAWSAVTIWPCCNRCSPTTRSPRPPPRRCRTRCPSPSRRPNRSRRRSRAPSSTAPPVCTPTGMGRGRRRWCWCRPRGCRRCGWPTVHPVALRSSTSARSGRSQQPANQSSRSRNRPLTGDVLLNMQVDIFSDVVCPWCVIGKRRFETALGRFEHADEVDVVWRAYELDPTAPTRREGDYLDRLAAKYGMSRERAEAATAGLTTMAATEGLDFHFERAQPGNTFDAHRLLHYAHEVGSGLQDALADRLFTAYFTEGAPIGDRPTLIELAAAVGLDRDECAEILAGDRYAEAVRADERAAHDLEVSGVPYFVIDGRFAIPGAQDAETILRVLERAWARSHPLKVTVPATGETCEGDSCAI